MPRIKHSQTSKKVIKKRQNWFWCYNMIFEQDISIHATTVYIYLCRCADKDGRSFPSHADIGRKCKIKSKVTVRKALKELVETGLIKQELRYREGTAGKQSNEYFITDNILRPSSTDKASVYAALDEISLSLTNEEIMLYITNKVGQEITQHRSGDDLNIGQEITQGGSGDDHKGLPKKDYPFKEGERGGPPAPTPAPAKERKEAHGEFKKVQLTADEYQSLIERHGLDMTTDYINRLDCHMASKGTKYKHHYATLLKWLAEDKDRPEKQITAKKRNRFANHEGHKRDYAEMERQEREYLMRSIGHNDSEDGNDNSEEVWL
jgi:DNA-binding transcriptional regulator YhcF (GntR family)